MRLAFLFPLALLAACSSEKPADDTLVTLDGADGASPVPAPVVTGPAAPQSGLQAVDAEGSKLEPLLSTAISAAGMDSAACKFSPAKGALPVLVASKTGGKGIISVAGRQIDVAPSGAVVATGGSFAAQGVILMVSASGKDSAGSAASMQVSDTDGPAFTYQDGFWACN
jgi:hypothetical protein